MSFTQKILIPLSDQVDTSFIEHKNVFESEGDRIALDLPSRIDGTKLLMNFEGKADESTDFTGIDLSDSRHDIGVNATAQIDSAYSQDGTSSLLVDGNSDWISVFMSDDFDFGNGDFCIELYHRPSSSVTNNAIFISGVTTSSAYNVLLYTKHTAAGGNMAAFLIGDDSTQYPLLGDTAHTLNVWQHIAVFRIGNTVYMSKDGTIVASVDVTGVTLRTPTSPLDIGRGGANEYAGNIDMVRIVKGDGVYSSGGFIPPSSFLYPISSPSPATVWTAISVGAEIDMSTAKCWMFKDGVIQAAGNTDIKFKYAINNGSLSASKTLTELRAESDPTVTDALNSFKAVGVYASDGSYESMSSAWLEVDVIFPENGGGGGLGIVNGGILNV